MAKDEWKEVAQANIWLPEDEGDELTGEVVKTLEGAYGLQCIVHSKSDGKDYMTPSHKVLQNRLAGIKQGDTIRIVYAGKEKSKTKGHQDMSMYKVFVRA